ncbi:unnamed protein product [Caenorhabditis angaria]|uniref:Jumonji domain-containing protein 4 n=1 Tax=Caenorhabditis angaria TaxID=860376 RepID=A0A9P1MY86_9PELO|nr:unnamed protein product [Caenorhabditis angaria]
MIKISNSQTPWLEILLKFGFSNKPFVFENWATESWEARRKWVNLDGTPNVEYLKTTFGNSKVPIALENGDVISQSFEEYLDFGKSPEKYLKDWHFQNEFGTSCYQKLHPFLSRDFVNREKWTENRDENPFGDDYRFVYYGASGSWTKFHSDVVSSHSWSANICGRKLWIMVPPGKEHLFAGLEDIREKSEIFEENGVFEFVQEAGEIVFVPSNWYHQVHNLTETISINHNWINSTNLHLVFDFIKNRNSDVLRELKDCEDLYDRKEFEDQIELVLFADARLNKARFSKLCELVMESRKIQEGKFWKCDEHGEELHLCISHPKCHPKILKICSCSQNFCEKCLNFIESLEFSISRHFFSRAQDAFRRTAIDF